MPLGPIFTPAPVNWSHPLNQGRLLWLYGIRPLTGGGQWYDICGRYSGTLSGISWYGGTGRGDVAINGPGAAATTEGVTVSDPAGFLAGMSRLTLAAWARATGGGGGGFGRIVTQNNQSGYAFLGTTTPQFSVGGTTITWNPGGSGLLDSRWHRWVGTYDGTTMRLYIDGVQVVSGAKTGAVPSSTAGLVIGNASGAARGWDGQIADTGVSARVWSPAEVQADYDLSRRGYPGVLNRIPLETDYPVLPIVATGWGPLLGGARNRRVLAG